MMKRIFGLVLVALLASCGSDSMPETQEIDFETAVVYGIQTSTETGVEISLHILDYVSEIEETLITDYQGNKNLLQWVGHKLYYEQDQAILVFDAKEGTLSQVVQLDEMMLTFFVSPGERYVAYLAYGTGTLKIIDLVTGEEVATFDSSYSSPTWSENDQVLALVQRIEEDAYELHTYDLSTQTEIMIEAGGRNSFRTVSWIPSTSKILFGASTTLFTHDVVTEARETIDLRNEFDFRALGYSHNGSYCSYLLSPRSYISDLNVVSLDGSSLFTPQRFVNNYSWSSNQNQVVYNSAGEIYLLDAETSQETLIGTITLASSDHLILLNWLN